MKGSVVLVAVTLAVAIALAAVLLLASSARGVDLPLSEPTAAGARSSHR
jgi:hypothetical protein